MSQVSSPSPIAGVVLPLARAEELMATLQSVVSARIVTSEHGSIDAIHVLVSGELTPKQVVRNVESALIAHLGLAVDHRKISVAVTMARPEVPAAAAGPRLDAPALTSSVISRPVYFEDVEFRGSRSKGSACRVTLRRGGDVWVGEAEGFESPRSRMELSARAALAAVRQFEGSQRALELLGVKQLDVFDGVFMFVAVEAFVGRDRVVLTGSCEIRDSAEVSSALAVLDATNRWMALPTS